MKIHYFLQWILPALMLMPGSMTVFSQTVKTPKLTEVLKPVDANGKAEDMVFSFECAAAWGDYNNDGYLDLITAGAGHNWVKTTVLYRNNKNGTFTKINHSFPKLQAASAVWLDYDNDGNLDLFLSGIDDSGIFTGLFRNNGAEKDYTFEEVFEGSFEQVYNGGGNKGNRYAIAGDYNNDGWTDLYVQGKNESGVHAILYKNENGFGFTKACPVNGTHSFSLLYANTAAFGDYNNDGFLDLLAAGYSTIQGHSNTGMYYKNNGNGTFSEAVLFEGGVQGEVAWSDFNNDGLLDFIITGYSFLSNGFWQADLFENKGDNTFTRLLPSKTKLRETQDCSLAWGDVNNDGFEDVLFTYSHPNALFLNNFGDKTFIKSELKYNSNATFDQNGGMACLVDFDRDNNLDVFTMGYGGNYLPGLLKNELGNGIVSNTPPTAPKNLKANASTDGSVVFSWDSSTDEQTPSSAIKYNLYVKKEGSKQVMFVLPADLQTGTLKVNEMLAPITSNSYRMFALEQGSYTFGVQAIDNAKSTSGFTTAAFSINASDIKLPELTDVHIRKDGNSYRIFSNKEWNEISIYNIQGMRINTISGERNSATIVNLSPGVYIVKIKRNEQVIISKIVL